MTNDVAAEHMGFLSDSQVRYCTVGWMKLSAGHNVMQTVFVQCGVLYRANGPQPMRCIGDEFVHGMTTMSRSTGNATTSVTIIIDTAKQAVSGQGVTVTQQGKVSLAKDNGDRTYAPLIRLAAKQVQPLSRPRRRSAMAPFRLPLYSLLDELSSWDR